MWGIGGENAEAYEDSVPWVKIGIVDNGGEAEAAETESVDGDKGPEDPFFE